MKKVFLFAMFVTAVGAVQSTAQLQKGSVLIGGDLAGFDLGLNEGSTFTMSLTPKVAKFVRDNVALGLYVDFGLSTAKGRGTSASYGVGALGRYYFPKADVNVAKSTRFFTEANVGIEGVNTAGGNSTNGLGLGFGPGLAYFVTNDISLESLLKYNGIIGFGSSATSSRLQLNLGFQIYLPSGKVRSEIKQLK